MKSLNSIWSQISGPNSTKKENVLNGLWTISAAIIFISTYYYYELNWSILQFVVVLFFVIDISGGISVNASNSAKLWWHRPSQGKIHHFIFLLCHVHPLILALIFPSFSWFDAFLVYLLLLAGGVIIIHTSPWIQRPVSFICFSISLLVSLYMIKVPIGLEWFYPYFYLKLFLAHLVYENINLEKKD